MHRSLTYSEAADVNYVLQKHPAVCDRNKEVFRSVEYLKYFDKEGSKLPDRSVITWRRIENHLYGCPEVMQSGPAESTTPRAPEAAPLPGPPPPPELQPVPAPAPPLLKEELPPIPEDKFNGPKMVVPQVPMVAPDNGSSPDMCRKDAYVGQVASAEVFLEWCRRMIDGFEHFMGQSSPVDQVRIQETLRELAAKVRQGEKVQAMAEVSLEATGSLCIFCGDHFKYHFCLCMSMHGNVLC